MSDAESMLQAVEARNRARQLAFDGFDAPRFGSGRFQVAMVALGQKLDEFSVKDVHGRLLITPRQSKHRWTPDEFHLRSLLLTAGGEVLSSGFPKFVNWGEMPDQDAKARQLMAEGRLEVSPKFDGSLIIMDWWEGDVQMRTRGSHALHTFELPVMRLISAKYPEFWSAVRFPAHRDFFEQHSVLFEYTAPDNQIVLKYPEASLTLLGYVDKGTLRARWDAFTLTRLSKVLGVPWAAPVKLPGTTLEEWAAFTATLKGEEGFVLRSTDGEPFLLKIKADEYRLLHSVKFGFNERKVAKLAFLLNIGPEQDLLTVLAKFGIDAECVDILRPWFDAYFSRLRIAEEQYEDFYRAVEAARRIAADSRKEFVTQIKGVIADHAYPPAFFHIAMKLFDFRWDEASLALHAFVLDESTGALKAWVTKRDEELRSLFKSEMDDDG